jgi:hypothetical protein
VQQGISSNQLKEMSESNVSLIVPHSLHKQYPLKTSMKILSIEDFVEKMARLFTA